MIADSLPTDEIESGQVEEEDTGSAEITETFNPADIRIETRWMTIALLMKRIAAGEIDLLPELHRAGGLWKPREQSRLIESLLIRIPLPPFYMDVTNEERWLVVDGLQRLTALKNFAIEQSLALEQLEFYRQYEGHRFADLPRSLQRRIEESVVAVYLIQAGTPPEVKFNIFKRINSGGLSLSAQEIRHALNQGPAAAMLKRLAETPEFNQATGGGIRDQRMNARECVLRFLAFVITPYEQYQSQNLDRFLNRQMGKLNQLSEERRKELECRFVRAMKIAFLLFGAEAFRKKYRSGDTRKPVNKALFEAWSVNLDACNDEQVSELSAQKNELCERFIHLMGNRDFDAAITQGTGDARNVYIRFHEIGRLIREVLS